MSAKVTQHAPEWMTVCTPHASASSSSSGAQFDARRSAACGVWRVAYYMWRVVCDKGRLACDVWHVCVTKGMWRVAQSAPPVILRMRPSLASLPADIP